MEISRKKACPSLQITDRWDRDELLAALQSRHVPAGAVNSIPELFALPAAQKMVLAEGGLRQVAAATRDG